jgi:hypothetical protein
MEIWKTIEGFENYQVSNFGNVKRKKCEIIYKNGCKTFYKEKILKKELNRKIYQRVTLSSFNIQKRFQVHRLVAFYFLENPDQKPCVNHIDGNGLNNHYSNLEWVTYSENEKHSYDILGKINPIRKLKNCDIVYIKNNSIKGKNSNIKDIASFFSVDVSTIYNVLNNKYYVKA